MPENHDKRRIVAVWVLLQLRQIKMALYDGLKNGDLCGTADSRVRLSGSAVKKGATVPFSGTESFVFSSGTSLRHIYRSFPPASRIGLRY